MHFYRGNGLIDPGLVHLNPVLASFLSAAQSNGARAFVANALAEPAAALIDGHLFPATISAPSTDLGRSYVESLRATYGLYAREELRTLPLAAARWPLGLLVNWIDHALRRADADRLVILNNWLLSTNLYPVWDGTGLEQATAALTERFADHFLAFRSLNEVHHPHLLARFRAAGWRLIPARQVWIAEAPAPGDRLPHNLRLDLKLLARTPLRRQGADTFSNADFDAAAALYAQLYLDKYSRLNPAFTPEFLRFGHESGLMRIDGLRDAAGRIVGVVGTITMGQTMTTPLVGYDLAAPRGMGLYRLLMAIAFERMLEDRVSYNVSSGAALFKKLRGARPAIEYTALYSHHLARPRQRVMRQLEALLNGLGVPIMRKYQL